MVENPAQGNQLSVVLHVTLMSSHPNLETIMWKFQGLHISSPFIYDIFNHVIEVFPHLPSVN